jgi:hypothetical protein
VPERFVAPQGSGSALTEVGRVLDLNNPQPSFTPELGGYISVVAGDFKRLSPRSTGMLCSLEQPAPTNLGHSIALYVFSAQGTLTISSPGFLVNGAATLALAAGADRIVRLWSDGVRGWVTEYAALRPIAANTILANPTSSAAEPQAFALSNNEVLGRAGGNIIGIGITTQAVLGRQGANITDIDSVANTWLGRDGGGDLDFYPPVGGGRASLTTPAAITNSASSIVGPTLSIPANTLAAGQVWRAVSWYRFSRGATATALDINARLRVTSDLVQAWVVSQTAAGEYQGRVEIVFAMVTTGAPGTAYGSVWLDHALGRLVGTPGTQAAHNGGCNVETATIAIDTTVSNTFQLRMAMTAAVASTTLTITHGVIERVF